MRSSRMAFAKEPHPILGCKGAGHPPALLQDVPRHLGISLVLMDGEKGTDRSKHLVEHTVEEFLTGSVTDASLHILSLQFVEIQGLWRELSRIRCRECLEISELHSDVLVLPHACRHRSTSSSPSSIPSSRRRSDRYSCQDSYSSSLYRRYLEDDGKPHSQGA